MGFASGYGEGATSGSPKSGRASWRKENEGNDPDGSEEAAAPGTAGGELRAGAVRGVVDARPALAGALGKCGSLGKETSGDAAGRVAGTGAVRELPTEGSTGGASADAEPVAESVSGSAEKNSLAMRARMRGSSTPPERKSGEPSGAGVTGGFLRSLVLIVLSNLDIIEHRDGVVGENRD
jgi:hypothetical protein